MIFDSINNISTYFNFKEFSLIIDYLTSLNLNSPNGNIDLNDGNYIKVMSDITRDQSDIIESHEKEVDVQILLKGSEMIKVYDINNVDIKTPYNHINDCQFYHNPKTAHSHLILREGYFAVFYPQDIHNPLNSFRSVEELKKIVIKLNLKWLQEKMTYDS